jgi:hypothetical protein
LYYAWRLFCSTSPPPIPLSPIPLPETQEKDLRTGLFLLLLPQSQQRHAGYFDNLEADTRNITNGLTLTTETGNQDLILFFEPQNNIRLHTWPCKNTHVLINEVQATVIGHESCDLLAVLDQLSTNALTNSRVRLLGFNTTINEKMHKLIEGSPSRSF